MQDRSLLLQSRAHQLRLTAMWSEVILWEVGNLSEAVARIRAALAEPP
jgi:hypothetical protein